MKNVFLALSCLILIGSMADASACSVLSPCKPIAHHVKKVKPGHKALAARVAGLERRLTLAEALLAAQQHQISIMRQQFLQIK